MNRKKTIFGFFFVLLFILFLICLLKLDSGSDQLDRAYISEDGDRYYVRMADSDKGIDGGSVNYFEMRVYPAYGSDMFKEIEKIKPVETSDKSNKDYLYKEVQAEVDCQKNKIKLKHTDYFAVCEEYLNSDIHEPEKWLEIDTAPMKAIKEAVCR